MSTSEEIDLALECDGCNDVRDRHLDRCEPLECGVVTAWEVDSTAPRAAAMAAMMAAPADAHECHDHRVVHDPVEWELDAEELCDGLSL